MWAQAAFMGLNLIGGFMTSNAQAIASEAQAREGVAQAKAKQEEANANSELARQIQRINNIRLMQAADKNVAAQASNIERMRKDFTQGNISAQIAASEAMGAYMISAPPKSAPPSQGPPKRSMAVSHSQSMRAMLACASAPMAKPG